MTRPRSLRPNQQKLVAEWNAMHPVGTRVTRYALVRPRGGETWETITRSEAWLVGGHTAMVLVDGLTRGVMVEALVPR